MFHVVVVQTGNKQGDKTMRTTNKQVTSKIRAYIQESIDSARSSDYPGLDILQVAADFKRVAYYPANLARFKHNRQAMFKDWMQGLPSILPMDYTNYDILQVLTAWGLPLPANRDDSDAAELFYWLIFREFCRMLKKAGGSL